jgi:hypothetical protein
LALALYRELEWGASDDESLIATVVRDQVDKAIAS